MRIIITILLVNLVVFFGTICRAENVEYDIEIVFFEDATNRYGNSEQWKKIESDLSADTKQAIHNKKIPDDIFTNIVENNVNSLDKYVVMLEKSNHYKVLAYKAWRQKGLDTESAIDVHINSTENINTSNSSIQGTVKIVLGRYLHVYTDMVYKKPVLTYTSTDIPLSNTREIRRYKEYSIKSHRRMRSNVLHYIDHPLVGILVKAIPVVLPDIEEENKEIDQPSAEHEKSTLK